MHTGSYVSSYTEPCYPWAGAAHREADGCEYHPTKVFSIPLFSSYNARGRQCRQAMQTRLCGGLPADLIFCFFLIKQKENKKNHLGSYCAITNANKQVRQRNYFDPWGNYQRVMGNPKGIPPGDPQLEETPGINFTLTNRGFTGHEHYPYFKIINMNGRLYDPVIGRFFSPDKRDVTIE